MKTLKKLGTLMVVLFATSVATAQHKILTLEQLPAKAQTLLKENFGGLDIATIWEETEYFSQKEYNVTFNDGSEIEFRSNGDWKEVKSRTGNVPANIVPVAISQHITKYFQNTTVREIKRRKSGGYEVELSNGLDLEFNSKGRFVRIDD